MVGYGEDALLSRNSFLMNSYKSIYKALKENRLQGKNPTPVALPGGTLSCQTTLFKRYMFPILTLHKR